MQTTPLDERLWRALCSESCAQRGERACHSIDRDDGNPFTPCHECAGMTRAAIETMLSDDFMLPSVEEVLERYPKDQEVKFLVDLWQGQRGIIRRHMEKIVEQSAEIKRLQEIIANVSVHFPDAPQLPVPDQPSP